MDLQREELFILVIINLIEENYRVSILKSIQYKNKEQYFHRDKTICPHDNWGLTHPPLRAGMEISFPRIKYL